MSFEKVGRLKPDEESDSIRVIVDDAGEIGRISRERMEMMVTGIAPALSSSDVVIELRVGGEMIRFLGWQVKGMMEKWPRKKAGVFKFIIYPKKVNLIITRQDYEIGVINMGNLYPKNFRENNIWQ